MNVLYTIGGLILGILIGRFIMPLIFESDVKQAGWPTQAPTQASTQAPTQAPAQAPTQAPTQQPMPAQAGGKRLFKNRYR